MNRMVSAADVCASQSSVLWVSASKSSEWNHESHETHEKGRPRPGIRQPHGTGATPHSQRRSPPRHPAFFVYFVYFVVVFLRVVCETATDERDAHTPLTQQIGILWILWILSNLPRPLAKWCQSSQRCSAPCLRASVPPW